MKTNVISMVMIALFVNLLTLCAQDELAEKQIQTAVQQLDQAHTAGALQHARAMFERLSSLYSDEWLPLYYRGLAGIHLSFRMEDDQQKKQLLDDAGECIDHLRRIKNLPGEVRSEITTLRGYWLYAQMAMNPAENGPQLTPQLTSVYAEALSLNSSNPRAIALNAYFQQSLASFTGGSYDRLEEDVRRAKELNALEDKDSSFPHWLLLF